MATQPVASHVRHVGPGFEFRSRRSHSINGRIFHGLGPEDLAALEAIERYRRSRRGPGASAAMRAVLLPYIRSAGAL